MTITETKYEIILKQKDNGTRIGALLVGLGGSNGSTLVSSLMAYRRGLTWETKSGTNKVEFLGSISQCGGVPMGDVGTKHRALLFKQLASFFEPSEIVVGGWDICGDNLYTANKKCMCNGACSTKIK